MAIEWQSFLLDNTNPFVSVFEKLKFIILVHFLFLFFFLTLTGTFCANFHAIVLVQIKTSGVNLCFL